MVSCHFFVVSLGPTICVANQGCLAGSNSESMGKREGALYMVSSEDIILALSVYSMNIFLICCNCRMINNFTSALTERNANFGFNYNFIL